MFVPAPSSRPAEPQSDPVTEFAPAKINLYLHVLGRRADGYHDLDSLVVFATACDVITVRERPGAMTPELTLDGRFGPALATEPPERNLVVRAAQALADRLGRPASVAIALTKSLPPASGIGGGSADAAATLRALTRLWRLEGTLAAPLAATADGENRENSDNGLAALARGLGADVPVCLFGRAAYFGGIGDRLDPVAGLPPCHAVLVNPGVAIATPAVFKARTGAFSSTARLDRRAADAADLAGLLALRGNDLVAPAAVLSPQVTEVLEALQRFPDCLLARMSGSGATCFGLFADADAVHRAGRSLAAAHPHWWVAPCRLVYDTAALTAADIAIP